MSAEQTFRFIRIVAPLAGALCMAMAAVAWQHEQWGMVALNCFVAGALADATLHAWLVLRTFFWSQDRARQQLASSPLTYAIRRDTCPDCGTVGFVHGPCGGMSMNVFCRKCGAKFNAHGANWENRRDLRNTFLVDRL
jgi:hypothetical protein